MVNIVTICLNIIDIHSLPYDITLGKYALSYLNMKLCYEHDIVKYGNIMVLMESKSEVEDLKIVKNCIIYAHLHAMRMNT